MDRENSIARGWSHVLSSADDREELEAFRRSVGAPPSALQEDGKYLHLDIKAGPRRRALVRPDVLVFDSTLALLRYRRQNPPASGNGQGGRAND